MTKFQKPFFAIFLSDTESWSSVRDTWWWCSCRSQLAINHRYFWAFFQFLLLMLQSSSSTPGALTCLFSCWGALLEPSDHSDSESEGLCVCIMPRTAHATDSWQADVLESFKMRFHNFLLSKSFSEFPVSCIMPSIYLFMDNATSHNRDRGRTHTSDICWARKQAKRYWRLLKCAFALAQLSFVKSIPLKKKQFMRI